MKRLAFEDGIHILSANSIIVKHSVTPSTTAATRKSHRLRRDILGFRLRDGDGFSSVHDDDGCWLVEVMV